ncbi:phospholipase D-like domain-containing protein [Tissierella creatinophila]|uniref:Cardiolipin synthase n=1 Tax=Tissierella creatinophila DSM 6911 TaxID=1123403 RepID=A0A1U7M3Q4_TISCR|nr:phospholipase D family protein [Tissierella creatinophila]OLS01916.1 cardiolipin synthase [Tissierella creatinophila DSM 6911]
MKLPKEIFFRGLKFYLVYIFIFAILLFAIQKPIEKKHIEAPSKNYMDLESRKKDRVALIESAEDALLVRLNLIESAEETLDISYYTLIDGKSTQLLLGSVLDAADRGVKVRILLDGIFHNLKGNLKDAIYGFKLHPNIDLKLYESFNLLSPWTWNNRLHDKLIISDKRLALIGGRNIGDKYFLIEIMKEQFVKDRDVVLFKEDSAEDVPSTVMDMKNYYNSLWNYKHSNEPIKKIKSRQKKKGNLFNENLRSIYKEFKGEYLKEINEIDWYDYTLETDSIKFVYNPIGRLNQDPWCLRELVNLASQTEKSIFIQSPYIIPSRNMKSKLNNYDIDLEKVNILTNSLSSSPNPFAIAGYYNNRKEMVDKVGQIYEFQGPESIHSKTYIFDDTISVIGSFNFDARSSYINSESMVVISSKEFTQQLKENVQVDLNNSLIVDKDYSYIYDDKVQEGKVSEYKKIIVGFLSKISFFLQYLL